MQLLKDRPRQAHHYRYTVDPDRELLRQHYQTHYGTAGISYSKMERAYLLGHDFGTRTQFRRAPWGDVSDEVRRAWEEQQDEDMAWEDVADAVRHGFERARQQLTLFGVVAGPGTGPATTVTD